MVAKKLAGENVAVAVDQLYEPGVKFVGEPGEATLRLLHVILVEAFELPRRNVGKEEHLQMKQWQQLSCKQSCMCTEGVVLFLPYLLPQ